MRRLFSLSVIFVVTIASTSASAQTPYPMLMSLDPVAVQTGTTTECELSARYNLSGASEILVEGDGVTAEVATEFKPGKDGKLPSLSKIKLKFTVEAEALTGVREFRVATPQGVSTLGQVVITRDPIVQEDPKAKNDVAEQAQEVALPATICGRIERAEDVDFYRFTAKAGQKLVFHVRCMRLQDKIHDLQKHADPILSLKNESGSTLAQSDNAFAGDPFLSYQIQHDGDYYLEIRDVRYQGNGYWTYSIESNDRPFVQTVHPLGLAPGKPTLLHPVGAHLAEADQSVGYTLPEAATPGVSAIRFPVGGQLSNPVEVVISDLPQFIEAETPNNDPATAQKITVPAGVSGRIESEADIDCWQFEAKKGERFSFEVLARRYGSELDPIIRITNADGRTLSENDDLKLFRRTFPDSWIEFWAAPADGTYTVEVRDLHLRGGDPYVYFLKATRSEPYFELYLDTDKTQLSPGMCGVIFATVVRKNGFTGEVQLHIDGLPEGVTAHCGRIPGGKKTHGCIILEAAESAPHGVAGIQVSGTAIPEPTEDGTAADQPKDAEQTDAETKQSSDPGESANLTTVASVYQETYQPGGGRGHWPVNSHTVSIAAPNDIRKLTLSTYDITLKPGETKEIDVTLERDPAYDKNITLDVLFKHLNSVYADVLPEGVSLDTKLSKTLLTGKQNEGKIVLKADAKAPATERQQISVMANISLNFVMKSTFSSQPVFVTVTPE